MERSQSSGFKTFEPFDPEDPFGAAVFNLDVVVVEQTVVVLEE